MKRNLILALTLCVALLVTASFSIIKNGTPRKKAHAKAVPSKMANCVADMGTVNLVSVTSSSFTVTWTYTGSPTSFNYGGYYNGSPFVPFPAGNTYSNTLTLPRPSASYGFRIGILCKCSDGNTVGSTHGILYDATSGSVTHF
ncbi:hypothetical protein KXD93_08520 [Mucilaginibacter sp. BJC16-A38]|uniref:hypothetical protein n=1 Tax=Mucilaginibacter phenanthrenivorans TaxID=1234842 RepID=UPI0021581F95|nr:hypothetical protein [Mucilaginibacter phenanthrenivorans]MCR8557682.1 hypothetical protein [Mucilaginibacter phenanthrenivorans]